MREVAGDGADRFLATLADTAPDLGRYVAEFVFGEIFARPGLTMGEQELITLSSLATQGGAEEQIRLHVTVALNTGMEPAKIVNALIHCTPYAGFPRVLNAVAAAKEIFDERGLLPAHEEGR